MYNYVYIWYLKIIHMATVDSRDWRLSLKDIIYLCVMVAALVGNYFALTGSIKQNSLVQDKVNAVNDLRLQTLEVQIGKLEIEIKELKQDPKR